MILYKCAGYVVPGCNFPTRLGKSRFGFIAGIVDCTPGTIFVVVGPPAIQLAQNIEIADAHGTGCAAETIVPVRSVTRARPNRRIFTRLKDVISIEEFERDNTTDSTGTINRRRRTPSNLHPLQHLWLKVERAIGAVSTAREILAGSLHKHIDPTEILQATNVNRLRRI